MNNVDEHEDEHKERMSKQLKSLVIPESQKQILKRGQEENRRRLEVENQRRQEGKRNLEKVREESISFKRRIISNWKLLKESLIPVDVIDSFISQELVEADLWDYIKNESRRSQMDSILSNVVKNIETSDDYNKFETIVTTNKIQLHVPRSELSIPVQGRLPDFHNLLRENKELIEKELYPKDHIDSFLEWFILSIEDHEELRNKENVRQHMANSFLQKIQEPIAIERGAMAYLIESFQKDKTRILRHLLKVIDNGILYLFDDRELQSRIEMRDVCRNSIISKWTYLKENFYPQNNLIDELCSCGLVDEDRAEIIKEKPRREQVYSTLRNIIRRIDGPEMFSKLVSILKKESSFIAEKLEEKSYKNCSFRIPCVVDGKFLRDEISETFDRYKNDIRNELYPTDVDTFMDKLVFDVDDHEIISETGNDENKKTCFYDKISDKKYIQKGSLDCLVFCLRNNEKLKKSRLTLADLLLSQHIPKTVKNRTAIESRVTDGVLYPENTSKFTEGELKLTVDDLGSKEKLEHEIFKVVKSSEYQDKEIGGLKLNVKGTERSSVVVHLKSNGGNVKLIVEKGIVNGDLSSFIRNLLDDEDIKMHMTPGHKYKISVSLHSKNQPTGVHGSRKMRIIKANRELLEEEYDPMPLLKSVFEENVKKYKSVENLPPQYVTGVFCPQFTEINKIPERRERVKRFMDKAEYMIDADTLWGLIEDTANAFSLKKLRDDLNDATSGPENIELSVVCSEEGLVFKGSYEVWITDEDVKSPLQSMILETNRKNEEEEKHLKEEEENHLKEEEENHLKEEEENHLKEEEEKHLKEEEEKHLKGVMSAQLVRSARKRKDVTIEAAASARKKFNQRVLATTSVPAPDTANIPTTSSAGVYPMLYPQRGNDLYTSASTFPATSMNTADTLLYSRLPIQREVNTVTSQDPQENTLEEEENI